MASQYLQVYEDIINAPRFDERFTRSVSVSGQHPVARTA
jgi:hypothetical protein